MLGGRGLNFVTAHLKYLKNNQKRHAGGIEFRKSFFCFTKFVKRPTKIICSRII